MFCENCGTKLTEGARFCENCGKAVNAAPITSAVKAASVTVVPDDLPECISINEDGDMQWSYKKNLITHTEDIVVYAKFTFWLSVFLFIVGFLSNDFDFEAAGNLFVTTFIMVGIMMFIGWIGTIIFYGGTLGTIMTMNERMVVYATMPKEAKKTKKLAFLHFFLNCFRAMMISERHPLMRFRTVIQGMTPILQM